MADKIGKSVYFQKPEDKRLLEWAQDVDMPALQINTFTAYMRWLLSKRFEEKEISEENRLDRLEQKLDDILYLLEGGIQVVDAPPKPTTLPEAVPEAHSLVSGLIDDEDW